MSTSLTQGIDCRGATGRYLVVDRKEGENPYIFELAEVYLEGKKPARNTCAQLRFISLFHSFIYKKCIILDDERVGRAMYM